MSIELRPCRHWKYGHKRSMESLSERNYKRVIRYYVCKRCSCPVLWNRKAIGFHVNQHQGGYSVLL